MSPSGLVIIRAVKPLPAPVVSVMIQLAPTSKSVALVVVTEPLLLVALLPVAAVLMSRGAAVFTPLYSRMRTSGKAAAALKLTVSELAPALAAEMFLAK
jgi:hypothetical protein